jgi:hypothetical protein
MALVHALAKMSIELMAVNCHFSTSKLEQWRLENQILLLLSQIILECSKRRMLFG